MTKIRVAGGIIIRDGKILAARRASGKLSGLFEFPGGKVEPGEDYEACLRRELDEELGLTDLEILGHYLTITHDYGSSVVELALYVCKTTAAPCRQTSHDLVLWVPISELKQYTWAPADLPAVEKLTVEGRPDASLSE